MTTACGTGSGPLTRISYAPETTQGTVSAGTYLTLRNTDPGGLTLEKTTIESQEISSDRMEQDVRHGFNSVAGDMPVEAIAENGDDLRAAAFVDTFYAPVTVSAGLTAVPGGGATTEVVSRAAGSWITDDFRIGDIVLLTTDTTTETQAIITDNSQSAAADLVLVTLDGANFATITVVNSVAFVGKRVDISNDPVATFSVERYHSDIDIVNMFLGCAVNTYSLAAQPDAMVTETFGIMGISAPATGATEKTPTAQTDNPPFASTDSAGDVYIDGTAVGIITGIEFNIDNGRSGVAVVGSNVTPCIYEGTAKVGGTVNIFMEDGSVFDRFKNETEFQFTHRMTDPDGKFMNLNVYKAKSLNHTENDPADGPVVQDFEYKGLKDDAIGTVASLQCSWVS